MGFFDSLPVRLFSIFTVSIAAISVLVMTTMAVDALNQPTDQTAYIQTVDIMATDYPTIPFEDATDISEQLSPVAQMENSETIQNIQNIQNIEPAAGE